MIGLLRSSLPAVLDQIAAGRGAPAPARASYRMRHAAGHYLWFETHGKIVFDADGQPIGAVFVTREITQRKLADDALRESDQRFRLLAENATDVTPSV